MSLRTPTLPLDDKAMWRRLGSLEARSATTRAGEKDRITRGALRRITTEDLRLVHAYLNRVAEGNAEPTEEE